jgi:molybdopterin-guanine dinucleotide biosynthesis protein
MKRPVIIGVGGTSSNVGKTTTAVLLLRYLAAGNIAVQGKGTSVEDTGHSLSVPDDPRRRVPGKWGAVKYTKTELYASFVDDKTALSQKDKDTGRFLKAGAEDVIWVKSPARDLKEVLPMAVDRLSCLDGIIVEGNSAIEFLKPDIVIFIVGKNKELWKAGTEEIVSMSDIIVHESESFLHETSKTKRLFRSDSSGIKDVPGFLKLISDLIYERRTDTRNNEKGC